MSIYEVIRVFNKRPIFLKDNILRLSNSLKKSNIGIDAENLNIPAKLDRLISLENMSEGNLKYVLHFTTGKTDEYIFSDSPFLSYRQGLCRRRSNPYLPGCPGESGSKIPES